MLEFKTKRIRMIIINTDSNLKHILAYSPIYAKIAVFDYFILNYRILK